MMPPCTDKYTYKFFSCSFLKIQSVKQHSAYYQHLHQYISVKTQNVNRPVITHFTFSKTNQFFIIIRLCGAPTVYVPAYDPLL